MMSVGHVFRSRARSHVGSHDYRFRDHGVTPQGEPGDKELTKAAYEPRTSHPFQFCSPRSEKPDKKSWREKKEQYRQEQRQVWNSRTPVPRDNTVANGGGRKNLNHITYFNCDKKGHYVDKCLKLRQKHANTED